MLRSLSSGEVIDGRWTRFAFPPVWHYDVLRGLDYLRSAGVEPDERVAEAVGAGGGAAAPERAVAARRPSPRSGPALLRHGEPKSARPAAGTRCAPCACWTGTGIELPRRGVIGRESWTQGTHAWQRQLAATAPPPYVRRHRHPPQDPMLTQIYIHLGVALAGLVSFLSPCVLPLVPPYLSYLGGTTIEQLGSKERDRRARCGAGWCWRRCSSCWASPRCSSASAPALRCSASGSRRTRASWRSLPASSSSCSACISWASCACRCSTARRACTPTARARAWPAPTSWGSPSPSAGRRASVRCWPPC